MYLYHLILKSEGHKNTKPMVRLELIFDSSIKTGSLKRVLILAEQWLPMLLLASIRVRYIYKFYLIGLMTLK